MTLNSEQITELTAAYVARHGNIETMPPEDGTTSDKYRAELYDEVWQRARDMGYANVTMALDDLAARTQPAPDQIDDVPMHPCIMQLDKMGDV